MRTNVFGAVSAVLVALEGLGLAALVLRQILAVTGGDTASIESALALIVLTLVGAIAVLAFALAIWRGRSWGRSGGIVTQLLILAVALGAVTGAFATPSLALALAVPAILTLILLVLAVRAAGRAERGTEPTDAAKS